ncbi:MAG: hypothetical protein WC254_01830 [Candidatus Woesearchaeota archaeon]|jgi:hypothetical protein
MNGSIDQCVQRDKNGQIISRASPLEKMQVPEKLKKHQEPYPDDIIKPMDTNHILRVQNRDQDLPSAPKETAQIPLIPDQKKADEDYNSVDYQIIAFNLWKSKARESF